MKYKNLMAMQQDAAQKYRDNPMYGTKIKGGGGQQFEWITYADFGQLVTQVRSFLSHLGIGVNDKVAIVSRNCYQWAALAYGTYGLGAQFVSMYENQAKDDIDFIIRDSGAKVVFTYSRDLKDRVAALTANIPAVKHVFSIEGSPDDPSALPYLLKAGRAEAAPAVVDVSSDHLMGLVYTSGTTGRPKGVMLSHSNILSQVEVVPKFVNIRETDRTLCFLPWAHIYGQVGEVHCLLAAGFSSAFAEDNTTIIQDLSIVRPTVLFAVPKIFDRIYGGIHGKLSHASRPIQQLFSAGVSAGKKRLKGERLNLRETLALAATDKLIFAKVRKGLGGRLRFCTSGAARLATEVGEFMEILGITLFEGYGLSETSPIVTFNNCDARRLGSVGKPIVGVTVKLDDSHDSLSANEGEIVVYGPNVMRGYHGLDEETKKVTTNDGGFRTGDIGRVDNDGFLYITGRIKEQFKLTNGKYVVPTLLEEQIKLSPYISQAFVYGADRDYNVALLGANMEQVRQYAEKLGIKETEDEAILAHPDIVSLLDREFRTHLTGFKEYEKPRQFRLFPDDWTPDNEMLTPSLKVRRNNVTKKYATTLDSMYH